MTTSIERTHTSRAIFVALIPFACLLALMISLHSANPLSDPDRVSSLTITGGRADLAGSSPDKAFRIRGSWEFYWCHLSDGLDNAIPSEFAPLPGGWDSLSGSPRYGYATYILRLESLIPGHRYAISLGQTISAARLLINGSDIGSIGRPGTSREEEIPGWNYLVSGFTSDAQGHAVLAIQISNHVDRAGGTNALILVGDAQVLEQIRDMQKITEACVFAILATLGCFFLMLYIARAQERSFLWFSLLCISVAVRTLCYDGFVLLDIFPNLPWEIFFRLGYLTFTVIICAFFGFLSCLFADVFHSGARRTVFFLFSLYSALIVVAPLSLVVTVLPAFQLLALGTALYGGFIIVRSCRQRREGAYWLLAGFSIALCAFVYDLLVSLWVLSGLSVGHVGMCVFLFVLAVMVIDRYARSYVMVSSLSAELQVINRSLRRFVPDEFLSFLKKGSVTEVRPGDCVEVEMAILSADIRSFTTIAERMGPSEVFVFLNEYLELVGPIVRSNAGFISKYEGDGFYALFPEGAESAVRASVQIQSAITARNRHKRAVRPLVVGIGLDAGKLTLGTIGDDSRLDGALISTCVRCAGKFEAATKLFSSKILINDAVFMALSDPLAWFLRPVDRLSLGGRTTFLFEIYNNDPEELRDLKWRTQGDLERAMYAWFAGQYDDSRLYLSRIQAVFPDDPVTRYYFRRLLG